MEKVRPLADLQRENLVRALERFGGDKMKAAEALGVSVRWIQLKIHEYDLADFHQTPGRPRKQLDFLGEIKTRRKCEKSSL